MSNCEQCGAPLSDREVNLCLACLDDCRTVTQDAPSPDIDADLFAPTLASMDEVETLWHGDDLETVAVGNTIKRSGQDTVDIAAHLSVQQHTLRPPTTDARPTKHSLQPDADGHADYEAINLLGEGGMGMVYAARQTCIDRTIAIKMLHPGKAADPYARAKFMKEASVTGELDHPNIVPVHELAEDASGSLFYVMKNVQGHPWSEKLASLSLEENLDILNRVADAVAFAHSRGILHRDLKPENIMLGGFGEVLVMDWGLAVPTDEEGGARDIARYGALAGTPAYMAPEMAAGDGAQISVRSDVYLLGAMLYQILTGRPPHTGEDVKSCLLHAAQNSIVPTDVDDRLVQIARRAMAGDPARRYDSVPLFQEALRDCRAHAESVHLCQRAREMLADAERAQDYQGFSKSLFAFQEALAMWAGNAEAATGALEASYAYATHAHQRGDLDLAASLLDPAWADHQALLVRIQEDQRRRALRTGRLRTLKTGAALLVAAVTAILAFSIYSIHQAGIDAAGDFRQDAMERVRQDLKNSVDIAYAVVDGNLSHAEKPDYLQERYGTRLRSIVQVAESVLTRLAREARAGRLTLAEAQRRARTEISAMRYSDEAGYLWITDMARPFPRMVMHPTLPRLNSKVLSDKKFNCAQGSKQNLFAAARDLCARDGSGFVDYLWPKPTPDGMLPDIPKLSYVQLFKPWGWVLGTGVYVDDARKDAIAKSKEDLREMRFNRGAGYFWINNMEQPLPRMVMHPTVPDLEGRLLNDARFNCALGQKKNLFVAGCDVCRKSGSGYIDYIWPKPTENGLSREEPKLSYVRLYKPLNWVIGCGVYTDDVERNVEAHITAMQSHVNQMIYRLLYIALAVTALVALMVLAFEWQHRKAAT